MRPPSLGHGQEPLTSPHFFLTPAILLHPQLQGFGGGTEGEKGTSFFQSRLHTLLKPWGAAPAIAFCHVLWTEPCRSHLATHTPLLFWL